MLTVSGVTSPCPNVLVPLAYNTAQQTTLLVSNVHLYFFPNNRLLISSWAVSYYGLFYKFSKI